MCADQMKESVFKTLGEREIKKKIYFFLLELYVDFYLCVNVSDFN